MKSRLNGVLRGQGEGLGDEEALTPRLLLFALERQAQGLEGAADPFEPAHNGRGRAAH